MRRTGCGEMFLALLVGPLLATGARAQIQDNSFLIEEAYNQEPGVVQHINTLSLPVDPESGPWSYSFTQEWLLMGQTHQLSYTIPVHHEGATGVGDILLNYRWQAVGSGEARIAVSPRLTLVLPSGDTKKSFGSGTVGVQINLPASVALDRAWAAHLNAGATILPDAESPAGEKATARHLNAGGSLIWLATPKLNPMLEVAWTREESVIAEGRVEALRTLFVNPGLRFALDFDSGLQVVPGVSMPIAFRDVDGSDTELSLLLYLSLEHSFRSLGSGSGAP